MKLTLEEIANLIDGSIEGDFSKEILGINSLDNADSNQISYAVSEKYRDSLIKSAAGAVIVEDKLKQYCKTKDIKILSLNNVKEKIKDIYSTADLTIGLLISLVRKINLSNRYIIKNKKFER